MRMNGKDLSLKILKALKPLEIAVHGILEILAQFFKRLTLIRDQVLTHALHLAKQAVVLLAILYTTFVTFVLQIIHNSA